MTRNIIVTLIFVSTSYADLRPRGEYKHLKQKALTSFLLSINPVFVGSRHSSAASQRSSHIRIPLQKSSQLRLPFRRARLAVMNSPTPLAEKSESKTSLPLAIFLSDDCVQHDMGPGHPEAPERLSHLISLARGDWSREFGNQLRIYEPQVDVTFEQLLRVHTQEHLMYVTSAFEDALAGNPVGLDSGGDTIVNSGTPVAALRAAGLVVSAVDALLGPSSAHSRAFVLARPPGHHAEPTRSLGFCIFNNVMVGVAHAEKVYGMQRIAVLDFDVHHGNGDEAMSKGHASRFYASSHEVPNFPGTGIDQEQSNESENIVNVPLPSSAGSAEFRDAWRSRVLPALKDFKPEMVFLSAGFDAHAGDPLSSLTLETSDFKWITNAILEACADVPLVSVLEGGYDIESLGISAYAHVEALVKAPVKLPSSHPSHELAKRPRRDVQPNYRTNKRSSQGPSKQWWTGVRSTFRSPGEVLGHPASAGEVLGHPTSAGTIEKQSSSQTSLPLASETSSRFTNSNTIVNEPNDQTTSPKLPWWSKVRSKFQSPGEVLRHSATPIRDNRPNNQLLPSEIPYHSANSARKERWTDNRFTTPHQQWWSKYRTSFRSPGEVLGHPATTDARRSEPSKPPSSSLAPSDMQRHSTRSERPNQPNHWQTSPQLQWWSKGKSNFHSPGEVIGQLSTHTSPSWLRNSEPNQRAKLPLNHAPTSQTPNKLNKQSAIRPGNQPSARHHAQTRNESTDQSINE